MVTKSKQNLIIKGKYKILESLFNNGCKPQYFRKIVKNTNLDPSIITRHLNSLTDSKILKQVKIDNNVYYSFNKKNPLICSIYSYIAYNNINNLEYRRKKAILDFINDNNKNVLFILLYGSTAKNNYADKSDIDILICVEDKKDIRIIDTKKYEAKYAKKINPVMITLKEFTGKSDVIKQIIDTGYCIFGFEMYLGVLNDENN